MFVGCDSVRQVIRFQMSWRGITLQLVNSIIHQYSMPNRGNFRINSERIESLTGA